MSYIFYNLNCNLENISSPPSFTRDFTNSCAVMKYIVGTTSELKNTNVTNPYIFIDTDKSISGICIPACVGRSNVRGITQIYTAFEGNNTIYVRKILDGNEYGDW